MNLIFSLSLLSLLQTIQTDWRTLLGANLKTGVPNEKVAALNHQEVKISGYIIPFEDDQKLVTEFLLVPTSLACIHVPPPPANQIIYVKMKNKQKALFTRKPVSVSGFFHVQTNDSPYGKVSYYLEGKKCEELK